MNNYVDSLTKIKDIRKASGAEELTKLELKQRRKYVGKLNWLAQSTRPDLCYTSLMSAKQKISDLKNIDLMLEKVKEILSKMFYKRIGNKDNLEIIAIGDASYKINEYPIG